MTVIRYFLFISAAISFVFSAFTGKGDELSSSILSSAENAVSLSFTLLGAMAFWGGVMRVAEKSGLVKQVSRIFRPVLQLLFRGIDENGEAFGAIVMNVAANLMGLGNAATPLGIKAIKALADEEHAGGRATANMIMLVVLNTASLQLLPTTIAALRTSYGSASPLDILPSILFSSLCALSVGITLVLVIDKATAGRRRI